jgi:hypothetical protein
MSDARAARVRAVCDDVLRAYAETAPSVISQIHFQRTPWQELANLYQDSVFIRPTPTNLFAIYDFFTQNQFLGYDATSLDDYVSLTRFFTGADKANCDWCAIVNGINELIQHALLRYLATPASTMVSLTTRLHVPPVFRKFSQHFRRPVQKTMTATRRRVVAALNGVLRRFHRTDITRHELLRDFVDWVVTVEYVETVWCPFVHLRQLSYERAYHHYDATDVDQLRLATETLRQHGRITCHDCVRVLNARAPPDQHPPSIFDAYLYLFTASGPAQLADSKKPPKKNEGDLRNERQRCCSNTISG